MTNEETVVLTRLVKAACPQQAIDRYTPDAWHPLLADLSFADCEKALTVIGRRQPFCAPADIRAEVRRMREDRLARCPPPAPPPDLADQPGQYLDALRAAIRGIADGRDPQRAIRGSVPSGLPAGQAGRAAGQKAS